MNLSRVIMQNILKKRYGVRIAPRRKRINRGFYKTKMYINPVVPTPSFDKSVILTQ